MFTSYLKFTLLVFLALSGVSAQDDVEELSSTEYTIAVKYALKEGHQTCSPLAGYKLHRVTSKALAAAGVDDVDERDSGWSSLQLWGEARDFRRVIKGFGRGSSGKKERALEEQQGVEAKEQDAFRRLMETSVQQSQRRLGGCNASCRIMCLRGALNYCDCCACCGNRRRLSSRNLRNTVKVMHGQDIGEIKAAAEKAALDELNKWGYRPHCLAFPYSVTVELVGSEEILLLAAELKEQDGEDSDEKAGEDQGK